MRRGFLTAAACVLSIAAGCSGDPAGDAASPSPTPSPTEAAVTADPTGEDAPAAQMVSAVPDEVVGRDLFARVMDLAPPGSTVAFADHRPLRAQAAADGVALEDYMLDLARDAIGDPFSAVASASEAARLREAFGVGPGDVIATAFISPPQGDGVSVSIVDDTSEVVDALRKDPMFSPDLIEPTASTPWFTWDGSCPGAPASIERTSGCPGGLLLVDDMIVRAALDPSEFAGLALEPLAPRADLSAFRRLVGAASPGHVYADFTDLPSPDLDIDHAHAACEPCSGQSLFSFSISANSAIEPYGASALVRGEGWVEILYEFGSETTAARNADLLRRLGERLNDDTDAVVSSRTAGNVAVLRYEQPLRWIPRRHFVTDELRAELEAFLEANR